MDAKDSEKRSAVGEDCGEGGGVRVYAPNLRGVLEVTPLP